MFHPAIIRPSEPAVVFSRWTVQPSEARKRNIIECLNDFKNSGWHAELDAYWFLAGADEQQAYYSWKDGDYYSVSPVNTPAFEVDRGFTGNGSTSRLLATWQWFVSFPKQRKFRTDLNSQWLWSRTNAQSNSYDMGRVSGNSIGMRVRSTADKFLGQAGDAETTVGVDNTNGIGLFGVCRDGNVKRFFKNGVQVGADVVSTAVTPAAGNIWFCGGNSSSFSIKQQAFGAIGGYLPGRELELYNAVNKYLTALGAA